MLNNEGFDLWADNYDRAVNLSEEADEYPFAGYKEVLGTIYQTLRRENGKRILDIGFGTGVLAKKLYDDGCAICGIDFSEKMIEIAREKMPDATLICHDFANGLPERLSEEKFDFIICTYAIHHLDHPQKVAFLKELWEHLAEGGAILIGDIAFETFDEMAECRRKSGDDWDSDEIYLVAEQIRADFPEIQFRKVSFCAGVFELRK